MAYTTIDDPSVYFQAKIYTGTGSSQAYTNDGNSDLQPDWWWGKERDDTPDYHMYDSNRGTTKRLKTNGTDAEDTVGTGLTAFGSDGFTLGSSGSINGSNDLYVAWQWKANGGTATATGSESGNNPAYSAQANQTAGFSIITYTGTGAEGDVTHGLGGKPDWIITKNRDESSDSNWVVWHKDMVDADADNGAYIYLNTTGQDQATSVYYEGDAISSTVVAFKGGNQNTNKNDIKYVMYCFRSIQGYSKFGKYTGNANVDGAFVYTGFKPAFVLTKKIDNTSNWHLSDNKRGTFNPVSAALTPDQNYAENTTLDQVGIDFLSNGFKCRGTNDTQNGSNDYIYMCFAESPFVSSEGVPTTAR